MSTQSQNKLLSVLAILCFIVALALGPYFAWTRFLKKQPSPAREAAPATENQATHIGADVGAIDSDPKRVDPTVVQKEITMTPHSVPVEKAKPADHFPIDIGKSFNSFVGASWKREDHDDDGIPGDGRVLVPGVVPRAYFQFKQPDEPNAVDLTSSSPNIVIPAELRGHFGRLAILSGSSEGDVAIRATLHYDRGPAGSDELRVQDWNRRSEPKFVYVHKALQAGKVQLYSQIFKLDPTRILQSVSFEPGQHAVIFALTAIVAEDQPFDGGK